MNNDYTNPQNPKGCRAVIPLSDGLRVILGDGTVAHFTVKTKDGDQLIEITNTANSGIFGGVDYETQVEVGIISDHEATQHPRIREALEDLGFWESDDDE